MGVNKYILLVCAFICLCVVTAELNLIEGSACSSDGINGTCTGLYKCGSAAVNQIYQDAGFNDDRIAKLLQKCSTKDNVPVVCCTDCDNAEHPDFKNSVIGPGGVFLEKNGPKARVKCLEYFQRLPYSCRGQGNVKVQKVLNKEKKCHDYTLSVALSPDTPVSDDLKYPHMVLLGYGGGEDLEEVKWYCGGFIISERFVLTAGHCLNSGINEPASYVRYAIKSRNDPVQSWKVVKIKNKITHPEYRPPTKYNDIALIEIETEFKFDEDCLPSCLDIGDTEKSVVYLTGFGNTKEKEALSDTLKKIQLEAVSEKDCNEDYPPHRTMKNGINYTTAMCYRAPNNGSGSCQGDGGSPIQVIENNCLYTAVGVTSFGKRCGSGAPDIYTRISHFVPWIESIVWP